MSFTQALSGLNAQQEKLGVVGNNIANSQTVGFKSSNVQFADVFANSRVGLGTRTSAVLQNFSQGNIESTNRNLDLAIAGEGFFRFQQSSGEVGYSRNGQLTMTSNGDLVNAQGARIMGYGLAAGEGFPFTEVVAGGQPQPLNVSTANMPAKATENVRSVFNLDSREVSGEGLSIAEVTTDLAADPIVKQDISYHFSNNFSVYDSLGNPHNVTVYYTKGAGANAWSGKVAMDGFYDSNNDFSVSFSQNGTLGDGVATINGTTIDREANPPELPVTPITFNNGANGPLGEDPSSLSFQLNIDGSSQFGNDSTTSDQSQDGYTSGSLVGITIEDDGTVMRNYSNEQSVAAGQITLVSFRNPEGLQPEGDNLWVATAASGQELVGSPGTGLRGLIESSAIETSNVDMARELVDMIVAQRAYQANSQTISTQDELLQTIINI